MRNILIFILFIYHFHSLAQNEIEIKVQNKISNFILKYASYPKTYKKISSDCFMIINSEDTSSIENPPPEVYILIHTFELKNNKGKRGRYQLRFVIDYQLRIMEINEFEDPDVISTEYYPPQLDWWFKNLGRKITSEEKIELGIE